MSLHEPGSKGAPVQITEGANAYYTNPCLPRWWSIVLFLTGVVSIDEAAVYDRQIRLWGLEAQQRSVFNLVKTRRRAAADAFGFVPFE